VLLYHILKKNLENGKKVITYHVNFQKTAPRKRRCWQNQKNFYWREISSVKCNPQILAYFKECTDWSPTSFLNYRKDADKFTGHKATEHFNYRTALERIILLVDSNRVKAKKSLIRFEDEKSSNPEEKFWTTTKMESIKISELYSL